MAWRCEAVVSERRCGIRFAVRSRGPLLKVLESHDRRLKSTTTNYNIIIAALQTPWTVLRGWCISSVYGGHSLDQRSTQRVCISARDLSEASPRYCVDINIEYR